MRIAINLETIFAVAPTSLWVARARTAMSLRKQRRALARLTMSQLNDIGITRAQAIREASRASWDAPHYWKS
jgi:uncharacterized protein YjiS (DUF1127 family)